MYNTTLLIGTPKTVVKVLLFLYFFHALSRGAEYILIC